MGGPHDERDQRAVAGTRQQVCVTRTTVVLLRTDCEFEKSLRAGALPRTPRRRRADPAGLKSQVKHLDENTRAPRGYTFPPFVSGACFGEALESSRPGVDTFCA